MLSRLSAAFFLLIPGVSLADVPGWWGELGSPELSVLIDEGLTASPDVRSATARIEQSRAVKRQTASSLYPSLTVDGSTSWAPLSSQGFTIGMTNTEEGSYATGGVGAGVSYSPDIWGSTVLSTRAAGLDVAASTADLDTTHLTLSTSIAAAWLDAVYASAQVALVEEQVAAAEALLEVVESQWKAGLVGELDVLQQRQQLATTATLLPQAQLSQETAAQRLSVLVGRPPEVLLTDDILPAIPAPLPLADDAALASERPDVRSAALSLDSAQLTTKSTRRSALPALGLSAGYDYQYTTASGELDGQWVWSAGVSLTVPVFNGGQALASIDSARAGEQIAAAGLTSAQLLAEQDIAAARSREQRDRQALTLAEAEAAAARAALDYSRARYIAGDVEHLTLLNATNTALQAELSLLSAHRTVLSDRIQLHDATGGVLSSAPGVSR